MTARVLSDGTCQMVDVTGDVLSWPSLSAWAREWLNEWRAEVSGAASEFVDDMTETGADGVLDALVALCELAAPAELEWVGAGPLEDLLSHSGHAEQVLSEVDRLTRANQLFKRALAHVWLGQELPRSVRVRLVELGAREVGIRCG